jgi:hypothetical protein
MNASILVSNAVEKGWDHAANKLNEFWDYVSTDPYILVADETAPLYRVKAISESKLLFHHLWKLVILQDSVNPQYFRAHFYGCYDFERLGCDTQAQQYFL